jgi:23S rRNA pseudouridine1911/1915/1917 synthase
MLPERPVSLIIPPEQAGQPLETLIRQVLGNDAAEQVMAFGGVWLNRRRMLDVHVPSPPGAQLTLHTPPGGSYSEVVIEQQDICYEDEWLLVVNKHPGWYSSPTPWDVHGHVIAALTRFLQSRDGVVPPLHNAHQLDRDTSGLLLCTKNPIANAPLQAAFAGQDRHVEKSYLCICQGEPPDDVMEIRSGHGRGRSGLWRLYPLEQVGMVLPNKSHVRLAHTTLVVEQREGDAAMLRATLHTGRTHQIRLHLVSVGHPILGDTRYGGSATFRGRRVPFHMLHAARLCLEHPITGVWLEFQAELPPHMATVLGQG